MKIYTSYFGKMNSYKLDNAYYLAITAYPPSWWGGDNYYKLAPPRELLLYYKEGLRNSDIDVNKLQNTYTEYYNKKVISTLSFAEVYAELSAKVSRNNKENLVLLCFEKSGEFCHRHIVADWFKSNGILCEELP